MLELRGAPALSPFRTQKLLSQIQAQVDVVDSIYAEFMHFVDVSMPLEDSQLSVLNRLLQYGPSAQAQPADGVLFLVVPRPGTISPWSSKATEISHNCGLPQIRRIERGIAYYTPAKALLKVDQRKLIAAALHDRMTEAVFHEMAGADLLFGSAEPKELQTVEILEQ